MKILDFINELYGEINLTEYLKLHLKRMGLFAFIGILTFLIYIVVLFYFPLPDRYIINDAYFFLMFSLLFLGDGINILLNKKGLLTKKYQGNFSYVFVKIGLVLDFLIGPPLTVYAVIDLITQGFYVLE